MRDVVYLDQIEQAEALLRGLGMPFPGMAEPAPEGEEE